MFKNNRFKGNCSLAYEPVKVMSKNAISTIFVAGKLVDGLLVMRKIEVRNQCNLTLWRKSIAFKAEITTFPHLPFLQESE